MKIVANPSLRCLLVWGLPVLLVLALLAAVLLPWWGRVAELDDRLERTREQIINYRRLVATLPGLTAELEQVRNRQDTKAFYFDAKTPELAGAELQSEVQDIIREAGARPVSTQILPVDQAEQPPRIRIRVQFQGTTEALLKVLYHVEAARPFLFIDQVSLRSSAANVPEREVRGRRRGNVTPRRERDELTLRLDIFGFVLQ